MLDRRTFLACSSLGLGWSLTSGAEAAERGIIDTHQHLWIRKKVRLPWIAKGSKLDRDFTPERLRPGHTGYRHHPGCLSRSRCPARRPPDRSQLDR